MVDTLTVLIGSGIATNTAALIHTLQDRKYNSKYGIIGNYRDYLSWAFGGGRNNPNYRALVPQHIVSIPLVGPGIVLGTGVNKLVSHFKKQNGIEELIEEKK